ncbi:YdcF family protein [bacterium]|nr:YdcF family protein [bacterium]
MFQKKYMFETKSSSFQRRLKNSFFYTFIFFLLCSVVATSFVLFSHHESINTEEFFFEKRPDLMVVFTGDSGRIPYALKLYDDYQFPKLFITGVYAKNTVESLVRKYGKEKIDPSQIEIDYLAQNTVGNIVATLRYLKDQGNIKNVLIITHDYHILRSKFLMNKIKDSETLPYKFHYLGLEANYASFRNIRILVTEFFKFLRIGWIISFGDKNKILSNSVNADNLFH